MQRARHRRQNHAKKAGYTTLTKTLFFDIDGTLWGWDSKIPQSTRETIGSLKKNGHQVFLCSGRTRAYIQNPELLSLGFDGIVSGCGTMIEYHGETLFYKQIEPEQAVKTVELVRSYGFRPVLEGREYLYMDSAEFAGNLFGDKLKKDMGDRLQEIADWWGKWEISKLSCDTIGADLENGYANLRGDYDLLIHDEAVVEVVPKGYHKGFGLLKTCELLGVSPADSYAFGDSANDLDMFKAAATAVAMGNGSEKAKQAADYVTDAYNEDGIKNACLHFGLI